MKTSSFFGPAKVLTDEVVKFVVVRPEKRPQFVH